VRVDVNDTVDVGNVSDRVRVGALGSCVWEGGSDGMLGVLKALGLCERGAWCMGVMAGAFVEAMM